MERFRFFLFTGFVSQHIHILEHSRVFCGQASLEAEPGKFEVKLDSYFFLGRKAGLRADSTLRIKALVSDIETVSSKGS